MISLQLSLPQGHGKNYIAAVEGAGARPVAGYCPAPDPNCDGLILCGGEDLDWTLFARENQGSQPPDLERDRAELALCRAFLAAGKPILGICRGIQLLNVVLGGDLIQDLGPEGNAAHQREGDAVHPVQAAPGSLLFRLYGPRFSVNSNHHQAAGRVGAGLRVAARSGDGVVEALEHDRLPLICVQFHPERMTGALTRPDTVDGGALFRVFLALAREAED